MPRIKGNRVLVQPIHLDNNYPAREAAGHMMFILRPGAFFWTAGRLYVGYAWLATMHHGDRPIWDPVPVEVGTIIETVGGFYQFTGVLREGQPYRRQYAQLQFTTFHRPDDSRYGFLKRQIDQGGFPVHEQYTLQPNTYLEAQWLGRNLLQKESRNGRNLERKIRRQPVLDAMRKVNRREREQIELMCDQVNDRARMIRRFAIARKSLKTT